MDHAVAHELGLLQTGNHAQHACLLTPLQLRLEPHEAPVVARQVVLPQLHHGVRLPARARIHQSHRLHRPEPQRVAPAMRHHLNGKAALEKRRLVEVVDRRRLGAHQRIVEPVVLVLGERAVEIVPLPVVDTASGDGQTIVFAPLRLRAFAIVAPDLRPQTPIPPTLPEHLVPVDRLGEHDRADGVVEREVLGADHVHDIRRQRIRGERSGGDDPGRAVGLGHALDLAPFERDERVRGNRLGDRLRKAIAIHGQRGAGRHPCAFGGAHHERAEPAHLFLEQANCVVEFVAAKGVAANQFREPVGLVNRSRPHGPHLVQRDRHAAAGHLPGRLGSRQSTADDANHCLAIS